ncbi:MAG: hypothetical protein JWM62_30 [Frankiales bacterium]|nr:hypothetical protein [Frankiales bacterium]
MGTLGTTVVLVLGVGLLLALAALLRRGREITWPSIGLAALASAACFVVAGMHVGTGRGPGSAITCGGLAGLLCLLSVVLVLLPSRHADGPPGRLPVWIASAGTLLGVVGLVLAPVYG